MATDSVVKGCFAFKGKKKSLKLDRYFSCDNSERVEQRLNLFKELWAKMNQDFEDIEREINGSLIHDLIAFINNSSTRHSDNVILDELSKREISTAALLTGVNTVDHDSMISQLTAKIRSDVSRFTVRLNSRYSLNLARLMEEAMAQLTDGISEISCSSKDDALPQSCSSMFEFSTWYKEMMTSSPMTSQSHTNCPVVIIYEYLEAFSPKVLQDFMTICSNYSHVVPFVFILCVSTTTVAVHNILPYNVTQSLSIEKFSAPPASHHLSILIQRVFLNAGFKFKLGPKTFQFLLDIFLCHEFSVLNFVTRFKFAMMDHFSSQPLTSVLFNNSSENMIKSLSQSDLDHVWQLPSIKGYVEKYHREYPNKKDVEQLLMNLDTYHPLYYTALVALHALVAPLPRCPLGKHIRELYAVSLKTNICETESYREAFSLLKCLSKDELISYFNRAKDAVLSHNSVFHSEQLAAVFCEYVDLLSQLDIDAVDDNSAEVSSPSMIPKRTNLHNLRNSLKEMMKSKPRSRYELLRSEFLDELDQSFRDKLSCPCFKPLSEVFYYDDVATMKKHFYPSPRIAMHKALSNPHCYLQCECCQLDVDGISASLPDICIVYKLHLECGQLINLYDWLQAFIAVISEDDGGRCDIKPDVIQARFVRAISELQFLGFIKPTKRKTDHVARLTWGNC